MRYKAKQRLDDPSLGWIVEDTQTPPHDDHNDWVKRRHISYDHVSLDLTQGQAEVIAFALNAVAERRYLAMSSPLDDPNDPQSGFDHWNIYDGPTGGV